MPLRTAWRCVDPCAGSGLATAEPSSEELAAWCCEDLQDSACTGRARREFDRRRRRAERGRAEVGIRPSSRRRSLWQLQDLGAAVAVDQRWHAATHW